MSTTKLEFEYDYDFFLIGIFCHYKDYRLAWSINRNLDFDLIREEDYVLEMKDFEQRFSKFNHYIESQDLHFFLINNRSENGLLIPEKKEVDYFLMVDGLVESSRKSQLISQIRELPEVISAVEVVPSELNSKQNLLIE